MNRVLLLSILFLTLALPAMAQETTPWGFTLRGGYSTPLQTGPGRASTTDTGFFTVGTRYRLTYPVSLYATVGYMPFAMTRDPLICSGPDCPSSLRTERYLVPLALGLRLAMGGRNELGMPYFEAAPVLAFGHWTRHLEFLDPGRNQADGLSRFAGGFVVGIHTPLRIGPDAQFEFGVSYMHLEALEADGLFGAEIEGLRHFQLSGGISFSR